MSIEEAQLSPPVDLVALGETVDILSEADLVDSRSRRKVYVGEEHSEVEIPLKDLLDGTNIKVYGEIKSKGYFQIRLQEDRLVFQAGKYVGMIPINDRVAIDIRPRVPLRNVEKLLAVAHLPPNRINAHKRRYDSHAIRPEGLLDALAEELLNCVDRIRGQGLLKPYSESRAMTSHPKGRILIRETFQRRAAGEILPVIACSFYQRSVDNPANRLIKSALYLLARCFTPIAGRKGVRALLGRINDSCTFFGDVPLDVNPAATSLRSDDIYKSLPPNREEYHEAVSLSVVLIKELGISLTNVGAEFALSTLVVDMSKVFEGYLRNSLKNKLQDRQLSVLDGNSRAPEGAATTLFLDDGLKRIGRNEDATPDMVVKGKGERENMAPLIVEVKYKLARPRADRDDINQAAAYALRYGSKTAVLALPSHSQCPPGLHFLGRIGHVDLHQYNVKLDAKDLDDEESKFADAIEGLAISSLG